MASRTVLSALIGALLLVATAALGQSQRQLTGEELTARMLQRRAVDAALWGMPLVNMDALRQAYFRDAQARYNDIVFWSKPSDWKNQTLTPNQSNHYVYFNFNTKNGPVVVEIPPIVDAGLMGTFIDAWNVPLADIGAQGEDQGKGGKYVLLPPDFRTAVPQNYLRVASRTFNGYALFRATPTTSSAADVARAISLIKRIRAYPLDQVGNPSEQRFIDMAGKLFDAIPPMDEGFYAWLMNELPRWGIRWWDDRRWDVPGNPAVASALTHEAGEAIDIDARSVLFFSISGMSKKAGAAFYLWSFFDDRGEPLRGERTYRLRVPSNVPTQQFWAITVYDRETRGLIREMSRGTLDSFDPNVKKNNDGSVDVFFGPRTPAGQESNWIPTAAGRDWFPTFRIYAPEDILFDKTWKLPDVERVR
jgi:hypothetical protein